MAMKRTFWIIFFRVLFSRKVVIMASLTLTLDTTDYGYMWFICIENKHFSLFPLYAAAPVWLNDADFGLDGTLTDIFFINLPAWFLTVLRKINCWSFFCFVFLLVPFNGSLVVLLILLSFHIPSLILAWHLHLLLILTLENTRTLC